MRNRSFWANLIRTILLIAAMGALLALVLRRDSDNRPTGPIRGIPWPQRDLDEARSTVQIEPRFPEMPPARRTSEPAASGGVTGRELVRTEAYSRLGAGEYHAAGHLGQGVTVAVIDTQFDGLEAAVDAGELPPTLTAQRLTSDGELVDALRPGGGPHGTACSEILHDLAPEAQLYLLQVDSFLETADRMFDILEAAGVRLVSVSISVLAMGRADGTGVLGDPPVPIYDILRDAYENKDMLVIVSAGNYARQHYAGRFRDLDDDGRHEFSSHVERGSIEEISVDAERGNPFSVHLSWDDWGPEPGSPSAGSDYDLYVYELGGDLVASSTITQGNGVPPVETVRIAPAKDGTYAIRVHRVASSHESHDLRIWVTSDRLPLQVSQVPEGSLGPPADAETVVTVGAANAATDLRLATTSQGPTADGRIKPDVTSYAQVSVSDPAYGPRGFTGTSAATPHVAGMAALLLDASGPATSASDLKEQLLGFAADHGQPGPDSVWGVGITALPPLGTDVTVNVPANGDDLILDGGGRSTLSLVVRRSDGTPLPGLRPGDFKVSLDGESGTTITVQDLLGWYILRVQWPSDAPQLSGPDQRSELTVKVLDTHTTVPVRTIPSGTQESSAGPRLTTVTPAQLYEAGALVWIVAALEDSIPIADARLVVQVDAPIGRQDILRLHDDGHSGDGVAGDGVYANRYPQTQLPGRYTFKLTAYAGRESVRVLTTSEASVDVATSLQNEDRDGMPRAWERTVGLNDFANDRLRDQDADGLTNAEEYRFGGDPFNWDTDGDWIRDGAEVSGYYQTLVYNADSDGGGRDDGAELRNGTDPLNPADDAQASHPVLLPSSLRDTSTPPTPPMPR